MFLNRCIVFAGIFFCVYFVNAQDTIRSVTAQQVTVSADPLTMPWRTDRPVSASSSVDQLMRFSGLSLIQRASGFAGEAMIQGLRGGQISTTIDGMKIHAACIDKMDPATAYVELDNIRTMNVSADGTDLRYASGLGASVNFSTQQPDYRSDLRCLTDASAESNGFGRRLRADVSAGSESAAYRIGYTYRATNDVSVGGGDVISRSGFSKHNINLVGRTRITKSSELVATAIIDRAIDAMYPVLLMDTRNADAYIGALTWNNRWTPAVTSSVKFYGNSVIHNMDDYSRPIEEIRTRRFMPNMNMPMHGTSNVLGLLSEVSLFTASTLYSVILDASYLAANATMDMIPLDTTVSPMHMINIGDARIGTLGVVASADHTVSSRVSVRGSTRFDVSNRTLNNEIFRSVLSGYFPGINPDKTVTAFSASGGLYYDVSETIQLRSVLSYAQRMPTQLEVYGFYIYDPGIDAIVNGNPDLKNESSVNVSVGCSYGTDDFTVSVNTFVRSISDYIATDTNVVYDGSNRVPIRTISNIGAAWIRGFDISALTAVTSWCSIQGSVQALWGNSVLYSEPLPLISPPSATIRTIVGNPEIQAELLMTGALAQERTSHIILPEDSTGAWWRSDILLAWQPTRAIRVQAGCTNLFDRLYHEHTSINNLPSAGRSFVLGARLVL